ncbi:ATP-binding protein [Bacillus sp. V59.32b]|uniref:ATP-binding protein n=1 Tax=Bacillus sp. V59.32b TaxID=1758642 RepID=UPI000E3D00C5|nr:ATP-binding protein [Bacillus sp. V59.32b]RFU67953.1 ATP-binding protein [Bacillus sp. V59.32b]
MRDPVIVPFNNQFLVIASDNSGGIGMKEKDVVQVPYHIVSYYSFRVALMECMAASAVPVSVIMQNFCGEEAWGPLIDGIKQGLEELELSIPVTGSTESNMELLQSAVGMSVLGMSGNAPSDERLPLKEVKTAVIGKPLVGDEVIEQSEWVAPLQLFKQFCQLGNLTVLPVGSKGIAHELKLLFPEIKPENIHAGLDIHKSAGPSTCFIISYPADMEKIIRSIAGQLFHEVTVTVPKS